MAPHGVYPCIGDDDWIAIACRNQGEWEALAALINEDWCTDPAFADLNGRLAAQDALDAHIAGWTTERNKFELQDALHEVRVPAAAVQKPEERIDLDPSTENFGLWRKVVHPEIGPVRVEGHPVHFSKTDWSIDRGGPCLGEHTRRGSGPLAGHEFRGCR